MFANYKRRKLETSYKNGSRSVLAFPLTVILCFNKFEKNASNLNIIAVNYNLQNLYF